MTGRIRSLVSPQRSPGGRGAAIRPAHDEQIAAAIEQTVPILGVLGAQLGYVVETTGDSAVTLLGEMQSVDDAAGNLVSEADRLAGLTTEQTQEIAQVASLARGTSEVIGELVAFLTRRDQAVTDLVEDVRGLSNYVHTIQTIARSTTTLALNARIEAARAGTYGAAFQVVADEVRELSRLSDEAARDIGQQIEHLAERLDETMKDTAGQQGRGSDTSSATGALTDQLNAVAQEQHGLIDRLETFNGQVEAASREMVASSATVHGLTTSMMGGLQFQDITRQVIEQVVSSLDQLGEQFSSFTDVLAGRADAESLHALGAALERIQAGYVMAEQRMIHARVTGGSANAGGGADIELF
jgi:methyl-accepting chemotaxis protein